VIAHRDTGALLQEQVSRLGDRVYLVSLEAGGAVRTLTFAGLEQACHRLAHFLAERGIGPEDRVSVLSDNCLELVVLLVGLQRYGATVNPVNVEVNIKNAAQILHDVEPRLVLWNRAIPDELRSVVEGTDSASVPFDELWRLLARYPAADGPRLHAGSRAVALIDYTSGTTSSPKGVCISHEAFFYMGRSIVERLGVTEADRVLDYRSLSWESPQILSLGVTLQAGATLVLAPRFSRRRFFDWVRDYRVTISAGVPTVLQMLLEEPLPVTRDQLPTLRFMLSSSAPLAPERQLEFERRYGIPVVQGCGMTEAGFMGINPPDARRVGSIGPVVPYLEAWFVADAGRRRPPGREGELVVRGLQMASAYLTGRGSLVPIPQDGFRTGDLGYTDGSGYLYLTGRKKDLIIRGGVNIAPMEITTALLAHPAVAEAATIGVPDEVYGEAVVSFVVPRSGASPDAAELLAHCRNRLSEFKLPREILVVERIPKTEREKVARERLLAVWQDARGIPARRLR
jgi:acyl-coenzyme A synthetase/AMP-(fatty) acid ligase